MIRRFARFALIAALSIAVPAATAATAAAAATAATRSRASFTQIENDVMCVECHESLALAQSPEAFSERAYIRQLIGQGLDEKQILSQLVANYGPAVLAKPPARGFNLLIYILPPAILACGIAILLITLPKWRRRSRLAAATPLSPGPRLDPDDERRLAEDLARHPG